MPLGGPQKERGLAASASGSAIRAFLRPEAPEPVQAPIAVAPPPEFRAPAPREPAPRTESKPEPRPDADRAPASAAALPARFFDPSQLTEKPRPLTEPPLDLLHAILARPGMVNLILYIDESGSVTSTEIDSATLPLPAAQRAAEIFAALRFSPGRIDGAAVKTRVRITLGAEERTKEN